MKRALRMMVLGGKKKKTFAFQFVTTANNYTATINLIKPSGGAVVISWGDGATTTVNDGNTATKTHLYATAGTYDVTFDQPLRITELILQDAKIKANFNTNPLPSGLTTLYLYSLPGLTYNANTNPLPSGLTYLYLNSLAGLTYNANTNPLPSGLTYLALYSLPGLTWQINASQPWPAGYNTCVVTTCPGVTVSAWTKNNVTSIQLENAYSQAAVDAVISAIYANRASFTYATPSLDLLGGSNAAPSGTYQAANPPMTGKEMLYSLVNDNLSEGFKKWTVQYQE